MEYSEIIAWGLLVLTLIIAFNRCIKVEYLYLSPMTQEDKYKAQGLKRFEFPGGIIIWAINAKNAGKKYNKRFGGNYE